MAARWAAGEEILTACNMDLFHVDSLDEADVLSSGETLEALQSCLDPSILSIFEDTPTIEAKGLDEESEATLLTALTEILDNVDEENLSPFDTLPESELLSGQKGREHSPLRRLLCLSRSPPEKDTLCNTTGKSLPRILANCLQRSDGEEEDDGSLSLSPETQMSSPDSHLLDWEGLTASLPVTFEQEGEDGISLNLGDLVRHMHPYCMAICMENEEGEQMLPEGGILLEVVDQGENGEPILAIPDMDLPCSLPPTEKPSEIVHRVSDEAEDAASDSSENIVVDDDDDVTVTEAPVKLKIRLTNSSSGLKGEMIKKEMEEIKSKSPSRRKKKKKCKEHSEPRPAEGRVLRSGRVRNVAQELPKKSIKEEKKRKPSKVPTAPVSTSTKSQKSNRSQTESQKKITTTLSMPETKVEVSTPASSGLEKAPLNVVPEKSQPTCAPPTVSSPKPDDVPKQTTPEKLEASAAAPPEAPPAAQAPVSPESPAAAPSPDTPQITPSVSEAPVAPTVPEPPAVSEPKPKALSLAEYRRLRQQKKPAPVESKDSGNSTKWPSLPELPKELPPIPCLPDPTPKDPRRTSPQAPKKEPEEVRPAWQPRGPCAPPTPEALLVPPSYMAASSSKPTTAAPKPQQTPEPPKPSPPQNPPAPAQAPVKNIPPNQPATAVPQSAAPPASLKPDAGFTSSTDRKCSPALSQGKGGADERPPPASPKSVELTKTCLTTTTEAIKPTAAAATSAPSASKHKVAQAPHKVPVVTTPTVLGNRTTSDANGTKAASAANTSDSQSPKAKPAVLEAKKKLTNAVKPQKARNPTQELIEAFTAEMGIEAADLTSLLEQFEETQAKVEHCVPEVSGRAAAVGNSSVKLALEKTIVERVRANDLSGTAALTPPATPPHQMWKPLAPMVLLGKSKAADTTKSSPSKVIQIEARPLPLARSRGPKPAPPAPFVPPEVACLDHDYCLPGKPEPGKRWNVKQQSFITIKPIKPAGTTTQSAPASPAQQTTNAAITTKTQAPPQTKPLDHRTDGMEGSSVLETPDASPAREEEDAAAKEGSPRRDSFGRSYRRHATCRTPSPASSPKERSGRSRKRRSHRSPSSASSSSDSGSDSGSSRSRSRSHSPAKKRYRPRHSRSSSSSSSRSYSRSPSVSRSPPRRRRRRYSYSSSRSGSWSRSRSRSQSPQRWAQWSRSESVRRPSCTLSPKTNVQAVKRYKEKAIEERRVVYVGRIRGTMTQKELKERFSYFGEIEDCTLHFREQGDNYGFVTYYNKKDAFTAIENGSKLRKPDELPFDLCFGGRRQFCQTSYADLDSSREYEPLSARGKLHALDFDTLLKQAQQNLKR